MTYRNRLAIIATWVLFLLAFAPSLRGDMITTTFASNNGQAGNMFDINVLNLDGILMEEIAVHLANGTWNLNIYTLDGSYVGNETNAAAWTLHDSITGLVSSGLGSATPWDIQDLSLDLGSQAFYVAVTNGTAMRYTNGTSEGSVYVSDTNLEILEGTGNTGLFGGQFRPRVWNGTIVYTAVPESSALMLILGSVGFVTCRRKRRSDLAA